MNMPGRMPDRIAPVAFLPVLTKARELDGKLLMAAHLAKRGYRVLLGSEPLLNGIAEQVVPGLFFAPLLLPRLAGHLKRMRDAGSTVIAWNEEGLVYPESEAHWYFTNRTDMRAANAANAIVAWGDVSARDMAAALPQIKSPILPLGNPRIDVLCAPFRAIYEPAVARIRQRYPRYVLINTNFDLVNHIDGAKAFVGAMRRTGLIGLRDEERFANWAVYRKACFAAFVEGIPRLRTRLSGVEIVIRPHPSEDPHPWQRLAQSLDGVSMEPPTTPVVPWLLGADALVHNSCTTAVEAFVAGTPAIAFVPSGTDDRMSSRLPNALSRTAQSWDDVAELVAAAQANRAAWVTSEQQHAASAHLADLPSGCERIAALAATLDPSPKPVAIPHSSRLAPFSERLLRAGWNLARRGARRLGLADRDAHRRFSGVTPQEVAPILGAFGALLEHPLECTAYGPAAVVVQSAAARAA